MPRCPLCGSELVEKVESVSLRGAATGSNVTRGSLDAYYGSVEFYGAPSSQISIKYYRCSNPDCPYLIRKVENY